MNRSARGVVSSVETKGRAGQTVVDALRLAHRHVDAPCAGRMRCLRCLVHVDLGRSEPEALEPPAPAERELVGSARLAEGWRLGCQARFRTDATLVVAVDEIEVEIPDLGDGHGARLAEDETDAPRDSTGTSGDGADETVIAVDIGTTTVVAVLARRHDGEVLARVAEANRQRSWGSDVLARIEAAVGSPEARAAMTALIQGQIEAMLLTLQRKAGLARLPLVHVCGNTTMLHLLEGEDPSGLARLPFAPVFLDGRRTTIGASRIPARLVDGISAFVGADIMAGLFACGLDRPVERPRLLVDIGTNGEMALALADRILVTATAAGPAFEGETVSCGSISTPGAIDHAWIEDGAIRVSTIGGEAGEATGICGSGLLDALACLRRLEIIDDYGGFADDRRSFAFARGRATLTQSDVRNLQLAKGAIAAGIDMLCHKAGIATADIETLYLAGGFGSTLLPASALDIGLLPESVRGHIETAGNTALSGTLRLATRADAAARTAAVRARIEVVELAGEPGFQDAFADAMLFPELDGHG